MSDLFPRSGVSHALRILTRSLTELLASMRFAIALLAVICITSVIGTVLRQHEPVVNYVNEFGPFWAELFLALKLNTIYSAWWFLLILGFLVTSTSLCIARHAPKYLVDMRNYKESIRAKSLQAFHYKAQADLHGEPPQIAAQRLGQILVEQGWGVRLQRRETTVAGNTGWMIAAKTGTASKLGYIAAHGAIVLICLGGLLDGDLFVRAQIWFAGKTPYAGGGMVADVAPMHRLSERTPAFRGNLMVAEGTQSDTAILNQSDGVLLQALPFAVELKKFIVEYYSSGMPKLFASEIVIHDKTTGEVTPARVEVNHPVNYKGIEIYQSSFDDGGSQVRLRAHPIQPGGQALEVEGTIGGATQLTHSDTGETLTLEYTALRVLNVENFADSGRENGSGADVRKVDLRASIEARLGAGHKTVTRRDLRNVGPSVTYKLRDAAGQAREFHNYMLPVEVGEDSAGESQRVFLLGVRETPAQSFRYLHVPVDREESMGDFVRLRLALFDEALRQQAARRYANWAVEGTVQAEVAEKFIESAQHVLRLFAGPVNAAGNGAPAGQGGLQALAEYIHASVPEAERDQASAMLIRILGGALFELLQLAREQANLAPLPSDAATQAFMARILMALSDAQLYPAPLIFQLHDFEQVQASVFQVARAPGKGVVYLGCAFLILGVFAMLYVRERRVWIWLTPLTAQSTHCATQTDTPMGTHATMALSSNRKTMDTGREFACLSARLLGISPHTHGGST